MATATKKRATSKKAAARKGGRKRVAGKPAAAPQHAAAGKKGAARKPRAADYVEPERSSPTLAEVDTEVLEFIAAIDRFKQQHSRPFPSWSEVLMVVRELGYRRP